MNISIVIPSYNSQDNLERTLAAISKQTGDIVYEVIVVDCSETDAVVKICNQFPFAKCHVESEKFMPGKGRNIGANLASGDLLIFVDSDVVLESDALQHAWNYYQEGNKIFGGSLELNVKVKANISSYLEHFYFNHESQRNRPKCSRSNLSSALMLFDREVFLKEGGFKNIPRMQDTELTERLVSKGYALTFTPTVIGYQIQNSPMNKVLRKILITGKNLYFIRYQKQPFLKKLFLFVALPLIAIFKILRIIFRHIMYQTNYNRMVTVLLTPLLFLSGFIWMWGFYSSMVFGGQISNKRD